LAYVESGTGSVGTELELEILDKRYPARVIEESPCDPNNEKLRV
jgi:dimethylglycine dehydrogenase